MQRGATLHHQPHVVASEQTTQLFYSPPRHHCTPVATANAPGTSELQHRDVCSPCAHACWLTPFPRAPSDRPHCAVLVMVRYVDCRPLLACALLPSRAHCGGCGAWRNTNVAQKHHQHRLRRHRWRCLKFFSTSIGVVVVCLIGVDV